ncbi:MAG: efflux RND transporter periplasmic adaptor subunit [Pseudomonadota bacterium]
MASEIGRHGDGDRRALGLFPATREFVLSGFHTNRQPLRADRKVATRLNTASDATGDTVRTHPRTPPVAGPLGAILVIAAALSGAASPAAAQQPPARVMVAEAELQTISDTAPVIARLAASVESQVATRVAGVIESVSFEVGDAVTQGQTLARLDGRLFEIAKRSAEANVAVAEAGVAVAEAGLALTRQTLTRQEQLRNSAAFARSQVEDLSQELVQGQAVLTQAQAQVETAKAAAAQAAYDLEHLDIRAPFDGVILQRSVQPGQYIMLGAEAATLLDLARLEIEADVPAEMISSLAPGTEVVAVLDGGKSTVATVRAVVPIETVSTRTRPVRFDADLSGLDPLVYAAGKALTLQIPISAPRSALVVPKDALVRRGAGWMVYVVTDGSAVPRTVTLGSSNGDGIEIQSGLTEGDLVVVRGNERLRPGQKVNPERADIAAKAVDRDA